MRALPWIAMGFVLVLVTASAGGWDLLPDWAGWVLVLVGTRALPGAGAHRSWLLALAAVALAAAVLTWVPAVRSGLTDSGITGSGGTGPGGTDADALAWALGLPQLGYVGLLAHVLSGAADEAGDRRAARWWSAVRTVVGVVAVLPALVIGGGIDALRGPTAALTVLAPVVVIVLLLAHGSRPWAVSSPSLEPADH